MSDVLLKTEEFCFAYPEQAEKALRDVSLTLSAGISSCSAGRPAAEDDAAAAVQAQLAPHGRAAATSSLTAHRWKASTSAPRRRGSLVQQNPEKQVVTDKVWHELAFGWNRSAMSAHHPPQGRGNASFFGIQTWYYKNVTELSGGQKQLLNLASIMVMQRSCDLDEPRASSTPIAAGEFLASGKINRESGQRSC